MLDSMIRITSLALGAVVASAAGADELPQRWAATELAHPDAYSVSISDLNDAGDATGSIRAVDPDILYQPYIYRDGAMHLVPTTAYWTKSYCINESCQTVAVDLDADHLLHCTTDDISDLGYFADLFGSYIYMQEMNESGGFCGYRPLGAGVFQAFTWDADLGVIHITPDLAYSWALDINDHGVTVGYSKTGGVSTAFYHQDGVRTDFGQAWPGGTRAYAIDNDGRILMYQYIKGVTSFFMYDMTDGTTTPITTLGVDATPWEWNANESGQVVLYWVEQGPVDDVHRLGLWSAQDGMVDLSIPTGTIGIMLAAINESGWVLGTSHDEDYELTTFATHVGHDFHALDDRIIGHESIFQVLPTALNASGQISAHLYFWNGDEQTVILSPARPGDVDGDGNVGVNDLLAVISAWGDWPIGSTCGPDLDMDGSVNVNDLLAVISDWH
ncbi:MAG: hypothetical protein P8K80_04010 [Phycisphaerales bacterium]|nr:hypothetical protein [Phycisphaerales bacterium]